MAKKGVLSIIFVSLVAVSLLQVVGADDGLVVDFVYDPNYPLTLEPITLEDNKIIIKLKNVSEVVPDKLLVLALYCEATNYRKILEPLRAKEETTLEIPLDKGVNRQNVTIRAIWSKLSKTYFKDLRLRDIISQH